MDKSKQKLLVFDLESDCNCVIEFSESHFIKRYLPHKYVSLDELVKFLRANANLKSRNDELKNENWFYAGMECSLMAPGQNWQQGQIKLRLDFIPNENKQQAFSLDFESDCNCIIEFSESHFIKQHKSHKYLSLDELITFLRANANLKSHKDELKNENWFYVGMECSLMVPGQNWQKGRLKLRLQFIPNEVEENAEAAEIEAENESDISPLDDIRQSLLNTQES